jgi:hypothetical protein
VLFNKVGTAPGMWMKKENTVYISLPGVPYEMKYIVENEIIPKIVKEYERAVIFRLGRILSGGAKGPGLFFILPCVDNIVNLDLRTVTFDVNFEFEVLIDSQLERNPLL